MIWSIVREWWLKRREEQRMKLGQLRCCQCEVPMDAMLLSWSPRRGPMCSPCKRSLEAVVRLGVLTRNEAGL